MGDELKFCRGCKQQKSTHCFQSARYTRCRECISQLRETPEWKALSLRRNARYVHRPPNPRLKTWMGAAEYGRRYRQANKKKIQEKVQIRIRNRLRTDPNFRLLHYLRSRPYRALLGSKKDSKTLEYLGIPVDSFRAYLESKFYSDMTWENYGPVWHLDHIKPLCRFDLTQESERKVALHWSNHQPLLAADNLRKGARLIC